MDDRALVGVSATCEGPAVAAERRADNAEEQCEAKMDHRGNVQAELKMHGEI